MTTSPPRGQWVKSSQYHSHFWYSFPISYEVIVSFLQDTHNRHALAHLWGWDMWCLLWVQSIIYIYTPSCWGYIGFTPSVRRSVRPASPVRSVAHTVLVGSVSYLCILSSNFRRCVACNVSCKISKFEFLAIFFLICNFDSVLFWLGIWCESLVWVIMGQRGVSQNAGILVVLVSFCKCLIVRNIDSALRGPSCTYLTLPLFHSTAPYINNLCHCV